MEIEWRKHDVQHVSSNFLPNLDPPTGVVIKKRKCPHLPAWYVVVGTHFSIWRHAMNNALNSRFFYRYLAQILFSTQFCFSRIGS
jgi:hypothetical protein